MRNILGFLFILCTATIFASELEKESLRFLLLGDWGKSGYNQLHVASSMATFASTYSQDFVLLLGDNFYSSGVQSPSDLLWSSMFENVYLNHTSLQIPYYPVLGNHDWGYGWTGAYAQVQYSSLSSYWKMPSLNYSMNFDIPGGGDVGIVFVETCRLAVSQTKWCNYKGGTVTYEQQMELINQQLIHIEQMLSNAVQNRPTWLLVVGHYEVFSAGDHGDMSEMKQYLLPLLEKYDVDAYICGHDHISEILTYGKQVYVVAGAGSMVDYLKATTSANLVWYGVGYSAFGSVIATTSSLTFSFIDTAGNTRTTYTIAPKTRSPTFQPTSQPTTSSMWSTPAPTASPSEDISYDDSVMTLSLMISAGISVGAILAMVFYIKGLWSYRKKNGGKKRPATTRPTNVNLTLMAKAKFQKNSLLASAVELPPLHTSLAFKDGPMPYDPLTCSSLTPPTTPIPFLSPSLLDTTINHSIYENQTLLNHHSINKGDANSVSNDMTNGASYPTPPDYHRTPARVILDPLSPSSNDHQQYQQRERAATIAAHLVEQGQGIHTMTKPKQEHRRYTTLF